MNTDQSPGSVLSSLWQQIRAVLDLVLDLSFKRFVTPRLVRMLYVLSLLAAVFYAVSWMFSGFKTGTLSGMFTLITAPVAFLLYLIFARVTVELILAIFRIADKIAPLSEEAAEKSVANPPPGQTS
jgi:di/tricarboxylate transporter